MIGIWYLLLAWVPGFSSTWPLILQDDRLASLHGSLKVTFQHGKSRIYKASLGEGSRIHVNSAAFCWSKQISSPAQNEKWGNRFHLLMRGTTKTLWSCEIYHRQLYGISMILTPITDYHSGLCRSPLLIWLSKGQRKGYQWYDRLEDFSLCPESAGFDISLVRKTPSLADHHVFQENWSLTLSDPGHCPHCQVVVTSQRLNV